jgi:hypothetical protein
MAADEDTGELGGRKISPREKSEAERAAPAGRPWISIYFACCRVYCRVYRSAAADAYVGWCPRCAGQAVVRISPDGTTTRFFRAQ